MCVCACTRVPVYVYVLCACLCVYMCVCHSNKVEVKEQLARVILCHSLFHAVSSGLNSGHKTWQQASVTAELSHQPQYVVR